MLFRKRIEGIRTLPNDDIERVSVNREDISKLSVLKNVLMQLWQADGPKRCTKDT
jgi:hypothetical protein